MILKTSLAAMIVAATTLGSAQAVGLENPFTRKYAYQISISRAASYQLMPGDCLQVDVTSGPTEARSSETILPKIRVLRILDTKTPAVGLMLAMNKKELRKMQEALSRPQPSISLRIVQKQPRSQTGPLSDDGIPLLDFEESTDLAQTPIPAQ